jgi:hypothetical protein
MHMDWNIRKGTSYLYFGYYIYLSARQLTDDYGDVRMYAPGSPNQIGMILTSWEL